MFAFVIYSSDIIIIILKVVHILGPVVDIFLFGKSTNQPGLFGTTMTSDKAVDGLYIGNGGVEANNCAHAQNIDGEAAEWWVNLEQIYKITSITVYNSNNGGGML